MKNKKVLYLSSTAVLLGLSFVGATVFADEGGSLDTKGKITFEVGQTPGPVNPVNPTDPVTPDNPVTPVGQGLSLDYASSLDFGKQSISSFTKTYYAKPDSGKNSEGQAITYPNYVQISDLRGTKAGWNLSVTQGDQFKAGSDELTGASLTFSNAEIVSVAEGSDSYKPAESSGAKFTLVPGTEAKLMTADENKGMGTWVYRFGNDNTKDKSIALEVPGSAVQLAKEYTTTLTWKLSNTPGN